MFRIPVAVSFIAGFMITAVIGDISGGTSTKTTEAKVEKQPNKQESMDLSVYNNDKNADNLSAFQTNDTLTLQQPDILLQPEDIEAINIEIETEVQHASNEADRFESEQDTAPDSSADDNSPIVDTKEVSVETTAALQTPTSKAKQEKLLKGVDPDSMKLTKGKYIQETEDGRKITFTIDAAIQKYVDGLFEQYEVPAGAAVILNSKTGRVIAFSQKRRVKDAAETDHVALESSPPAASIFKIVTTAALMDKGISLNRETCYTGGATKLTMQHLSDTLPKNHACISLIAALGKSANAVFAKLSDRFLESQFLEEYANRFGFNRPLDFDVPVEVSVADIPQERLEKARASAGFWHTHLSPLHGAVIAQSLAQGGAMLRPYMVEQIENESGKIIYKSETKYIRHVVSKENAELLKNALVHTTVQGTARKSFQDPSGRPFLPNIVTAGKTGTLTKENPYRAYTWFVGLAPVEKPEIAIAVLVVNSPKWRIKASQMTAMILKKVFDKQLRRAVTRK